ncbi:MAG TPA: Nramp family divalent metal transporter [Pyrinomonadaceae bacterium]|nr:Nramp family divalent metal transporter [Pyrinomonadaceae bacterium]
MASTRAETVREAGRRLLRRGGRGVRRAVARRRGVLAYLAVIGPGMVAANAGNDAGGIATYASAGADYGYHLLWTLIPLVFALGIVQETCARMGAVTGKGLSDLIREQFGVRWTVLVMLALLVANGGVTVSEFVGIAAATELFGVPRYVSVPLAAFAVWWLVVKGSYRRVERVFLVMSLVFLGYIVSAFLARPDWTGVARGLIRPEIQLNAGYLFTIVALIGTTISPYMQVFVQSSVVEKGVTEEDYALTRFDVWTGTIFSVVVAFFIIVATAATLNLVGVHIETADAAAKALEPLAGPYAKLLFAVGLFGASMLAAAVLPLSTAYSISEALGFEKGVSRSFREAPIFLGIFTFLVAVGGLVAMIPSLPLISVLLVTQVINGLLLPVILISVLRLVNKTELMGAHANGRVYNAASWLTVVVVSALSLLFIVTRLFPSLLNI